MIEASEEFEDFIPERLSWFKLHVADFLLSKSVRKYSLEEIGLYFSLLLWQWQDGSIPSDPQKLAETIGRDPRVVRRLWHIVCAHFSEISPGSLQNLRLRSERDLAEIRRSSASKSANKRWLAHANALLSERSEVRSKRSDPPISPKLGEVLELIPPTEKITRFDFDAVYALYPRHEGKAKGMAGCKAKIKTQEQYDRLVAGVKAYATQVAGKERQYIAQWSTWINGERWNDEYGSPPASSGGPPRQRLLSDAVAEMDFDFAQAGKK